MSAEHDSCFGKIPIEMKSKIFSFLTLAERKTLRTVCRNWRTVINDKLKFGAILSNKTEPWLSTLFRDLQIESLEMRNLTKTISMTNCKKSIPNVTKYEIGRGNSAHNLLNFLRTYCTQGQNLKIQNMALANLTSETLYQALPNIKWPSLSTLYITMGSMYVPTRLAKDVQSHNESIIPLIKSIQVGSLKNLAVRLDYADNEAALAKNIRFQKPLIEILSFIIKHSKTLEELKISFYGRPLPPSPAQIQDLLTSLGKLRLQTFAIEFDKIHADIATAFCQELKGMRQIVICESFWFEVGGEATFQANANIFRVGDVLQMNSTALRSFYCQCANFDMTWLCPMVTLEYLALETRRIGFIHSTPFLPSLRQFKLLSIYDDVEYIMPWWIPIIVEQIPNLEILELIFLDAEHIWKYIDTLLSLKKLRMLTVGEIDSRSDIEEYCNENLGLHCEFETRGPIRGIVGRYDCAIIYIHR